MKFLIWSPNIPSCETLHDVTNILQNLITEPPCHIQDWSTPKGIFKKFQHQLLFKNCNITYWRQKSGSDARLFAVKLAILPNLDKKINKDISDLCMTLSEIIYICKSEHHQRTSQNLFRRNNFYFCIQYPLEKYYWSPKEDDRPKFFGCHFRSLVIHAHEILDWSA